MTTKETYWSRYATDFEERNNYIIGEESMEIVLAEIAKEKNIGNTLELACGNGTYSKVLIKNAETLTATDFSEEMVAVSKERLKSFENIKVEQANCFNLPYADNSFDTVFMANLLHVVPEPSRAVAEAKRVLKQGGQLIVVEFTHTGMSFFNKLKMLRNFLKYYGKPPKGGVNVDDKKLTKLFLENNLQVDFSKIIGSKSKAAFGKATFN